MSNYQFYRPDLMELAASYQQYSVIVTTAELDRPGPQILYANSAFTRMTGYSIGELLGRTPRILQGPKTDREILKRLRLALQSGQDFIARAVNYKRDGTEFEIEWIINHLRDSSGRTTHYVALQRDITGQERALSDLEKFDSELRVAGESLVSTMRQLEAAEQRMIQRERLAALGQMAAGVVHDLRNALTPIANYVRVLHGMTDLPPDVKKAISGIGAGAEHGLKLLENLRSFYATGQASALDEVINLSELVQYIPAIVQPRLFSESPSRASSIQIKLEADSEALVTGNPIELTQVLVNLVLNAVDAMPTGGIITIRLQPQGSEVVLSVSDTGTGLSPELIERCFEPYVTTKSTGSGLGLSVCYGIIQRHGGRIVASNNSQGGAVFSIFLPIARQERPNAAMPSAPVGGQKILYVDDDEACRESTEALLSAIGYDVTCAATGDSGLHLAHEHEYDVVITDTHMMPTTGIDVAMLLQRTRPQLPVILASGVEISTSALPSALRNYVRILKPFSPAALRRAIAEAIQRKHQAVPLAEKV